MLLYVHTSGKGHYYPIHAKLDHNIAHYASNYRVTFTQNEALLNSKEKSYLIIEFSAIEAFLSFQH